MSNYGQAASIGASHICGKRYKPCAPIYADRPKVSNGAAQSVSSVTNWFLACVLPVSTVSQSDCC